MKRCHIFVSGMVQGVFFRAFTQENALELGLTGWVRNTQDDRVEALVEGDENEIKELIERLRQGTPASRVTDVSVNWQKAKNEFNDFSITR